VPAPAEIISSFSEEVQAVSISTPAITAAKSINGFRLMESSPSKYLSEMRTAHSLVHSSTFPVLCHDFLNFLRIFLIFL
jgi:hypothetical protein